LWELLDNIQIHVNIALLRTAFSPLIVDLTNHICFHAWVYMLFRFGDRCYFCEEPCVEDQRVTTPLVPVDSDDNDSNSGNGSSGSDVVEVRRVYHPECLHCVASGHPLGGSIAGESSDDVPEVFFGDDDGLPYSEDA